MGSTQASSGIVDVIVLAQRDAFAAARCVAGVLASRNDTSLAVIAVVDPDIEREFRAFAAEAVRDPRVTLITPGRSLDYADAVNCGINVHADRDVVLLQARAGVHGDWLDRLAAHARGGGVGIVATFTNAAGIATYPRPGEDNPFAEDASPVSLDACFAGANDGQSAAAAAVFGPCVYVTRACAFATGVMRAFAADDADGSAIDFCLRAERAGFRSIVAGDTFVANAGDSAWNGGLPDPQGDASALARTSPSPEHAQALRAFAQDDSARVLARRVDLARLAASPRPAILFVSHAWGGGVRRHMNDLATLVQDRADVLYLEPATAAAVKLHWPRAGEAFAAWFRLPGDWAALVGTLRAIGIARMHFHHVHDLPRSILELPRATDVPYDCTLHDYFAICPQYHLTDERGRYCGEPDAAGCAACIARRPGAWGLDIGTWRSVFGEFLGGAERVIAPSQDVATRMRRYFPAVPMNVWSHPEAPSPRLPPIVRVVTLGNLTSEKGLRVVAACADDARTRGLPMTFRVLGATEAPIAQSPDSPLTIHGAYPEGQLPRLLAAERADVLFFPAQWPETFSYTLSAALATDTPIVAAAIGAFTERLAGRARVRLLPFDASAAQWNAAILDAAGEAPAHSTLPPARAGAPLRATS
jgi:glycosyltransferase involved in cell wall biosynthesis